MSVKAVGIALKLSFEGMNQFKYFETWFFTIFVIICCVFQLNYLNKVTCCICVLSFIYLFICIVSSTCSNFYNAIYILSLHFKIFETYRVEVSTPNYLLYLCKYLGSV